METLGHDKYTDVPVSIVELNVGEGGIAGGPAVVVNRDVFDGAPSPCQRNQT